MDLDDLLKSIREEGTGGKIVPAKFFGEDKYDKYYKELLSDGRIKGDNLTPDERKEGVKAYRKGKIKFKNFVEKALERKKNIEVETNRTPSIDNNGKLVIRKTNIDVNNFKSEGTQENLEEVLRGIDSILETLKRDQELEEKKAAQDKKKQENEKRKLQEEKLEKRFEGLRKTSEKIIKPVKSILDRIIGFFTKIILGRIVFKLVEWLGDPKNQSKVNSIIRFLTDFGPKLLATYLVFGTGVGRAIRKLTGLLIKGAIRLGAAALLLLKKMGLRKAGGLARGLLGGRGRALATVLEVAGTAAAIGGISKLLEGDGQPDDTKEEQSPEAQAFNQGGKVEGPTGIDKVPAMLTAGEFVMSKGAVQKYGVDTLKEMNASGGGTNKPKVIQNKLYAQGGGYLGEEKEKPPARGLRPIIPQASSPVTNIFQQQGLARGTRATAGFTGMGKPGFDAISGGAKYIQSSKPQILGRGAYSAPTSQGAMRYAGSQGSLGGSQVPGGVIRTIVPGGAARIPFLEPQMKVAPEVFDKGRLLADKLQSGYRPNSALANKLRGQMASGAGRLPGLKGGSILQMIANLALGNVLDRGVEAVGKPLGNALTRTLLTLMGKKERASKINPKLFGMAGPQLTSEMVENYKKNKFNDSVNTEGKFGYRIGQIMPETFVSSQTEMLDNTSMVSGVKQRRGQGGRVLGSTTARGDLGTRVYKDGHLVTSYDKYGRKKEYGKPEGFMRALAGFGDLLTGNLFDFDRRTDRGNVSEDRVVHTEMGEDYRVTDDTTIKEAIVSIGKPDLLKFQHQILSQLPRGTTIQDVMKGASAIPGVTSDQLLRILSTSDAYESTRRRESDARRIDKELRGIKPGEGYSMFLGDEVSKTAQLATTTPSVSLPSPPVRPQAKVTVIDGGATVSQTAMETTSASFVPPIPSPPKSASKSKILGIPLPF